MGVSAWHLRESSTEIRLLALRGAIVMRDHVALLCIRPIELEFLPTLAVVPPPWSSPS
jgi:hypothetical protein